MLSRSSEETDKSLTIQSIVETYGPYPLHKLAEIGCVRTLVRLLDHGFSANDTNFDCLTPLHTACNHNQLDCAKALIHYGASQSTMLAFRNFQFMLNYYYDKLHSDNQELTVNASSIDGATPLCDACAVGSVPCVELLMSHGANVNPPLVQTTPLHEACMKGSLGCTSLLIKAGARLNVNDCHFGTPLHAAAMMDHPHCVKLLLQAGAAVNATKIHRTALHIAARGNLYDVAKVLLEFGANVYASDNQNKLPVELLPVTSGPMYDMLIEYSSNPRCLSECCRKSIRAQLGPRRLRFIATLSLPNPLLAFLLHA